MQEQYLAFAAALALLACDGNRSLPQQSATQAERSFELFDTNHDGFVSLAEWKRYVEAARTNLSNEAAAQQYASSLEHWFVKADRNRDGLISKLEWSKADFSVSTELK